MRPRIERLLLSLILSCVPALGQTGTPREPDLTLEDLMNVQVTSVSKKEQKLAKTGAAVFVITREDIRHSGATNIPDLLRMVPGVSVAQVDGNKWAISIRGFTGVYANKVLVLIDGRSVYSPASSGVFWFLQDVPLEDIARIEVIRGPGGTVWGANAVNGVINILTLHAKETQGSLVSLMGGSQETGGGMVRYGGTMGRSGAYRIFGSGANFGKLPLPNGGQAADEWHKTHGGFRTEWEVSSKDAFTIQGDFFELRRSESLSVLIPEEQYRPATLVQHASARTGNLLGRWNRVFDNGSEMALQTYFDYEHQDLLGTEMSRQTVDFDFQHRLSVGSRNELVWGAGYRSTRDYMREGTLIRCIPDRRTDSLFSTFAQNEIRLTPKLSLTVGSKFEHIAFTGFEVEPGAQVVWSITPRKTFWISAAQAIRQPARIDATLETVAAVAPLEGGGQALLRLVPNTTQVSERLRGFELGYRAQMGRSVSFDLSGFSNYYSRLQSTRLLDPYLEPTPNPPHVVIPVVFAADATGHTYGAEISTNWSATKRWHLSSNYSLLHMSEVIDPARKGAAIGQTAGLSPRHQFQVRSQVNVNRRLEWDFTLSQIGHLDGDPGGTLTTTPGVPGYTRLDSRIGWKWGESIELSIVGQNLLSPRHVEFPDQGITLAVHSEIPRRVFAKLTWRF